MSEKLDYLNLEINTKSRNIISLDKHKMICRSERGFKHRLHSEDEVSNGIVDLIINLGESLNYHQEKFYQVIELVVNALNNKNKKLSILEENVQYIKNQNEEIIKKLTKEKTEEFKEIETETKRILEATHDKNRKIEEIITELKEISLS